MLFMIGLIILVIADALVAHSPWIRTYCSGGVDSVPYGFHTK